MTRLTRKQVITAAQWQGLSVERNLSRVTVKRGSVAVSFWDDGDITRADGEPPLAKTMTLRKAAETLGLSK